MTSKEITDKSLLMCTIKKSVSILVKTIKYGSYLVVGLTAAILSGYGLVAVYEVIAPAITAVIGQIVTIFSGLAWYYQIVAVGIVVVIPAIVVYSFSWCVARELTGDDWKSESANNSALLLLLLLLLNSLIALTLIFGLTLITLLLALFILALVIGIVGADNQTSWYYIFRFPGAVWHHYRKKV